jgi:hypothetical protein
LAPTRAEVCGHSDAFGLSLFGTEPLEVGAAPKVVPSRRKRSRRIRYPTRRASIAPGGEGQIVLKAPTALRKQLAKALRMRRKIVRCPTVTLTDMATGKRVVVKMKITSRRTSRRR